ncbi:universal stress protein [Staphylococcus nepalensis]|uniref:universal stress protein n=1 Tax=Staphylococcus nepalensis TaxID=214473 RepID=UPI001A9985ED|nr:universal stress protein [Staphylococcus nepalensis]MBO1217477.1 universal stress protein [Staphylococcus nepalensis]
MYEKILVIYDCEERYENLIKELNKLTCNNSINQESPNNILITFLILIPQPKLENSIAYKNKDFKNLVQEEKMKFDSFFEEIKTNDFNYEVKYVAGNFKEETLLEVNTKKYELVIVNNRRLKLQRKDILGDAKHKVAKNIKIPIMAVN